MAAAKRRLDYIQSGYTPQQKKMSEYLPDIKSMLLANFEVLNDALLNKVAIEDAMSARGFPVLRGKTFWTMLNDTFKGQVVKYGQNRLRNIRVKPTGSQTYSMKLSLQEVEAIHKLREGNASLLVGLKLLLGPNHDSAVAQAYNKIVQKEVESYSTKSDSILRKKDTNSLLMFNINELNEELKTILPTLSHTLNSCIGKPAKDNIPGQTALLAKLMSMKSQKMSAYRYIFSSLLTSAGCKADTIDMLSKTHDTVSYRASLSGQDKLAEAFKAKLNVWKAEKNYAIVFDNVDKHSKPRHFSTENANKMHHMVQAIAFQSRVAEPSGVDDTPIKPTVEVMPEDLLPTQSDFHEVREELVYALRAILAEHIPALEWIKPPQRRNVHKYTEDLKKPTEQINLGVELKNENIHADICELLTEYNHAARQIDGKTLLVGDWLSFKRAQAGIESVQNGETASDRNESLFPVIADFHAQMEMVKLIFKTLYDTKSSKDIGSLYSCRNILDARNVTAECKDYYSNEQFIDTVTDSYAVLAAYEHFGVNNEGDFNPAMKAPLDKKHREVAAQNLARQIADKYVKFDLLNSASKESFPCGLCNAKLVSWKNLKRHIERKHDGLAMILPSNSTRDAVQEHSKVLLAMGLVKRYQDNIIHWGNGDKLMKLYKILTVWCKSQGFNNYAVAFLELQFQLQTLPGKLRHSITWNRFVNHQKLPNTNFPLDQALEHANGFVKSQLTSYRGSYTTKHLARISRGADFRLSIQDAHAQQVGHKSHSGRRHIRSGPNTKDILKLVNKFKDQKLFSVQPSRRFECVNVTKATLQVPRDTLTVWSREHIDVWTTKPYYRPSRSEPEIYFLTDFDSSFSE